MTPNTETPPQADAGASTPMTRIAFLGLGAMGRRMVRRLLAAGHDVTVWNRTAAAAAPLLDIGARWAATPRAAAEGVEVVWAMVFDDDASRDVWLHPTDGAALSLSAGVTAIESSTLTPSWVRTLGVELESLGARFLDAPVAGSRPQAEAGQLVFMVGGETATLEQVRPLLDALGNAVHAIGPVGSGAMLKLSVNALFAIQVAAVAEQLNLLRRAGLDPRRSLDALRAMPVMSPAAAGAGALMLAENYAPQAPVDLIVKDLGYALEAAGAAGAPTPVTALAHARYRAAQLAGSGAENLVAIAKLFASASV
jgi:3-hydroxyisobutyrate dehydrogenase